MTLTTELKNARAIGSRRNFAEDYEPDAVWRFSLDFFRRKTTNSTQEREQVRSFDRSARALRRRSMSSI